nr:RbsD/FucU family protein [Ruegeria arenilitoris]
MFPSCANDRRFHRDRVFQFPPTHRKFTYSKATRGSASTERPKEDRQVLKGIDPRLNADVLYVLRAMGHGDMLIVADTNFPSESISRATVYGELLRMENLTAAESIEAVLSVYPLDTFVDDFAGRMEVVGEPNTVPPVQQEVQEKIDAAEGAHRPMVGIERFDFYDLARESYAVIQTGERRFYGCFMLRKGVIPPES